MGSLITLIMPMGWVLLTSPMPMGWVLITLPTPMGWVLITSPMPMGWGGYHSAHAQGAGWSSLSWILIKACTNFGIVPFAKFFAASAQRNLGEGV